MLLYDKTFLPKKTPLIKIQLLGAFWGVGRVGGGWVGKTPFLLFIVEYIHCNPEQISIINKFGFLML